MHMYNRRYVRMYVRTYVRTYAIAGAIYKLHEPDVRFHDRGALRVDRRHARRWFLWPPRRGKFGYTSYTATRLFNALPLPFPLFLSFC